MFKFVTSSLCCLLFLFCLSPLFYFSLSLQAFLNNKVLFCPSHNASNPGQSLSSLSFSTFLLTLRVWTAANYTFQRSLFFSFLCGLVWKISIIFSIFSQKLSAGWRCSQHLIMQFSDLAVLHLLGHRVCKGAAHFSY